MPSPVGHSLAGVLSGLLFQRRRRNTGRTLLLWMFLSILPDLDFLPGWLVGQPNLFHRGASHSLLLAILVGSGIGLVIKISGRGKFLPPAIVGIGLYALHILMDLFSVDSGVPKGFQVLWPFDQRYVYIPLGMFLEITRSSTGDGFFRSLFNSHTLRAVVNEMILFAPAIMLAWGLRKRPLSAGRNDAPKPDEGLPGADRPVRSR